MKILKSILTAFWLMMPVLMHGQDVNLLLEDHLEELAADDEEVNWEDVLEEISQPIDINTATREQLERLPFLSETQIENLLAYVYTHGQMQTIYELQLVEEMDQRTIQLLLPFVEVNAQTIEKHFPQLKNIAQRGKHEVLSRLDIPFYKGRAMKRSI